MRLLALAFVALAIIPAGAQHLPQAAWAPQSNPDGRYIWAADGTWLYTFDLSNGELGRVDDQGRSENLADRAPGDLNGIFARPGLLLASFGEFDVYFAGHKGFGTSRDGGETWTVDRSLPDDIHVHDMTEDPVTGWLYAATTRTVYRSEDGGVSWVFSGDGLPVIPNGGGIQFIPYHIAVLDGRALLATTLGVFRSEDGGQTWESDNRGYGLPGNQTPEFWEVEIDQAGREFAAIKYGSRFDGLWRRDDGIWTRVQLPDPNDPSGIPMTVESIVAVGDHLYIVGTGRRGALHDLVFVSSDGGETWTGLPEGLPVGPDAGAFGMYRAGDELFVSATGPGVEGFGVYRRPLFSSTTSAEPPLPTGAVLQVYPNPARSQVTVEGLAGGDRVDVFDALGRRVATAVAPSGRAEIDVALLPPGTYTARSPAGSVSFVVAR